MCYENKLSVLIVSILWFTFTQGSHLHGGYSNWKVVAETGTLATVKFTSMHYSRSHSSNYFSCYETYPGYSSIGSFSVYEDIIDSDLSSYANWNSYQSVQNVTVPIGSVCKMRASVCCWVSGLYNFAYDWSSPVLIDLRRRSDTGKFNSAPIAMYQPLTRFVRGCSSHVIIPLYDEDGDYLSCRYGKDAYEKGDVYNYPYFTLSSNGGECRIDYNGGAYDEKVPIALIIEDRISSASSQVLSFTSLQFIIEISSSSYGCSDIPVFSVNTPPHNQVHSLSVGVEWELLITVDSKRTMAHLGVSGPNNVAWSQFSSIGSQQYQAAIRWTPLKQDKGHNPLCYSARDSQGLYTEQRCLQLIVDSVHPCLIDNGGCSDICTSSGLGYYCSCSHACWSLDSDARQCIPDMEQTCSKSRMGISVARCAVDGNIGLGDFDDGSYVPPECRPTTTSTNHVFDFALDECGTTEISGPNEVKNKNTVKMWVETEDQAGIISRGQWYYVDVICTSEKSFEASGSFDPEDAHTTIVKEDGFAEIAITFDFYTDETFKRRDLKLTCSNYDLTVGLYRDFSQFRMASSTDATYPPYSYPIQVDINDDVYFAILAQSSDTDLELFTESCEAKPDPDPAAIGQYSLIEDGCLADETMKRFPSNFAMMNQFSVKAFRFKYGLPGITENTNVVIQCRVVVCVAGYEDSTCARGCVSSRSNHFNHEDIVYRYPSKVRKEEPHGEEQHEESEETTRDPSVRQTEPIPLINSGGLHIKESESVEETETSTQGPYTSTQTDHATIHLLNGFLLWCSVLLVGFVV